MPNWKLPLPQLRSPIGGGLGGGPMHKRTTPKTFTRAKELHRNMSPAEAELWKHLRAHRMGDVHFRNQHAIGNYIVDFSPEGDDVRPSQEIDHRAGWEPASGTAGIR